MISNRTLTANHWPCALQAAALALLLPALAHHAAAQPIEYHQVCPGVSYAHLTQADPLSIHIVKFDYHRPELKLITTLGQGTVFGLASVRKEMAALAGGGARPLAAVNGDFFIIKKGPYQGDPLGLQLMGGRLVSSADGRPAFWVDPAGEPHIGRIHSESQVLWPDGIATPILINKPPATNAAVLFTPLLGPSTRATNNLELVLAPQGQGPWLPLHADQTYLARIREVRPQGNTPLAPDTMVLSIGPKLAAQLAPPRAGTSLKLVTGFSPPLKGVQTAVGGGPALVAHGRSLYQRPKRKAAPHVADRNPRSAIGWNDNEFFFVVVDGRKKDLSIGVGFPELAQLMLQLGCREALNLDGGGSSTLWLGGKVINHPSEKGVERNVANALVLVRR